MINSYILPYKSQELEFDEICLFYFLHIFMNCFHFNSHRLILISAGDNFCIVLGYDKFYIRNK